MNRLRDMPDVRADRVEQIRQQIADGTYENDHKLKVAIDRLIESFSE
jgi:negative regulator of flagellin synthesis FlgM